MLCIGVITPADIFATEPLLNANVTRFNIQVDDVAITGDSGVCSYFVYDGDALVEGGIVDRNGKFLYSRYPQWVNWGTGDGYEKAHLYDGCAVYGKYIVDWDPIYKYGTPSSSSFSEEYFEGAYVYQDYGIYDLNGKQITTIANIIAAYDHCNVGAVYIWNTNFTYGMCLVSTDDVNDWEQQYCYIIDIQEQKVISKFKKPSYGENIYTYLYSYSDGLIDFDAGEYDKDDNYVLKRLGYYDKNGREAFTLDINEYGAIGRFSDGLAIVVTKDGKCGFIDTSGKVVIPCTYSDATGFYGGCASVADSSGKYGYIDKSGKTIIPFQYNYAYYERDGVFPVSTSKGWGLVDKNNTVVLPFEYKQITASRNNTVYAIDKDGYLCRIDITSNNTPSNDVSSIFKDVPSSAWYKAYLQNAYNNGIVGGMSANMYGPQNNLTHAQILVIVANLHSLQKGDQYDFAAHSVPGGHWCSAFLNYCKAEGIIDSRFDNVLNNNVNRGEMAYYFANALTSDSYVSKKSVNFTDISGNPYAAAINKLASADIVGGYSDGSYKPGNLVTRAEVSVFVSNIISAIGK